MLSSQVTYGNSFTSQMLKVKNDGILVRAHYEGS